MLWAMVALGSLYSRTLAWHSRKKAAEGRHGAASLTRGPAALLLSLTCGAHGFPFRRTRALAPVVRYADRWASAGALGVLSGLFRCFLREKTSVSFSSHFPWARISEGSR